MAFSEIEDSYSDDPVERLCQLALDYRYLRGRWFREADGSLLRRDFAIEMQHALRRFDTELVQLFPNDGDRTAWRDLLDGDAPLARLLANLPARPPETRAVSPSFVTKR